MHPVFENHSFSSFMESCFLRVTFGEEFMTIFEQKKTTRKIGNFRIRFNKKLFDNFQLKFEIISVIQSSNW